MYSIMWTIILTSISKQNVVHKFRVPVFLSLALLRMLLQYWFIVWHDDKLLQYQPWMINDLELFFSLIHSSFNFVAVSILSILDLDDQHFAVCFFSNDSNNFFHIFTPTSFIVAWRSSPPVHPARWRLGTNRGTWILGPFGSCLHRSPEPQLEICWNLEERWTKVEKMVL